MLGKHAVRRDSGACNARAAAKAEQGVAELTFSIELQFGKPRSGRIGTGVVGKVDAGAEEVLGVEVLLCQKAWDRVRRNQHRAVKRQ